MKKSKIQIKSIFGETLFEYGCEDNTIKKTVEKAIVERVDLSSANLSSANLNSANLSSANLRSANLSSANLRSANLRSTKNLKSYFRHDINILKIQPGKIRAYKYLDGNKSPYREKVYKIGETYSEKIYCVDEKKECAAGLSVASLEWCLRDTGGDLGENYYIVEFTAKDIVAIPYFTDGKFRVKKFKIIREVTTKELKEATKNII